MQAQSVSIWPRRWVTVALFSLAITPMWALDSPENSPANEPGMKTAGRAVSGAFRRMVSPFARNHEKKMVPEGALAGEVSRPPAPHPGPPAARPQPQAASPVREGYVIGPEDVLDIHVWQEPQISRVVPVRPDGKISLPLIGEVKASGETPLQLQARISEGLKAYLANPGVTVIVEKVNSQKFNILGEVLRPGSYDLAKTVSVLDALAVAGGFREFAKVKDIYVLRRTRDGSTTRLPFNYKEFMKGRNSDQNVDLQPGDTIVVP